jgi:hypothetical protein
MSVSKERVQGELITVRTPLMIRRIMIWDMDAADQFGDDPDMKVLRPDGRKWRGPDGEEQSDGGSGIEADGRDRRKTGDA